MPTWGTPAAITAASAASFLPFITILPSPSNLCPWRLLNAIGTFWLTFGGCGSVEDVAYRQGLMHRKQTNRHSTSWSARRRKDSEIVSPRALAAVRLITSVNLVGC